MTRVPILVFAISLFSTILEAQDHFYSTRSYTVKNGLPQSQVSSLLEDKNGYLWIGTKGGGLARFDGREFKVYTTLDGLLTNFVSGLDIDAEENLWILHPNGISRYDGLTFTRFQSPYPTHSPKALRRLILAGKDVYALTHDGNLARISGDSVHYWNKPLVEGKMIRGIYPGPDGKVCFYLRGGEVYVTEGSRLYAIETPGESKYGHFYGYRDEVRVRLEESTYRLNFASRTLEKLPATVPKFVLSYDG